MDAEHTLIAVTALREAREWLKLLESPSGQQKPLPAQAESWGDISKGVFRAAVAPFVAAGSGVGRLLEMKFKGLQDYQQMLIAARLAATSDRLQGGQPSHAKSSTLMAAISGIEGEKDPDLFDYWVNLLQREIAEGTVHPQVCEILYALSSSEARVLAYTGLGHPVAAWRSHGPKFLDKAREFLCSESFWNTIEDGTPSELIRDALLEHIAAVRPSTPNKAGQTDPIPGFQSWVSALGRWFPEEGPLSHWPKALLAIQGNDLEQVLLKDKRLISIETLEGRPEWRPTILGERVLQAVAPPS